MHGPNASLHGGPASSSRFRTDQGFVIDKRRTSIARQSPTPGSVHSYAITRYLFKSNEHSLALIEALSPLPALGTSEIVAGYCWS